jgi:hypothetical protein
VTEQFITQNQILRVPHPPYSPDIAPPDFWLFGRMGISLSLPGRMFDEPEQLREAITELLNDIQPSELEVVFQPLSRESPMGFEEQWRLLPRVKQSFPETSLSSLS